MVDSDVSAPASVFSSSDSVRRLFSLILLFVALLGFCWVIAAIFESPLSKTLGTYCLAGLGAFVCLFIYWIARFQRTLGGFLMRRMGLMIVTLIGISVVTFIIIRMAPGDPAAAQMMEGSTGGVNKAKMVREVERARRELLGLNQPVPVQYWNWVKGLATMNFGNSWSYNVPVGGLVLERLQRTLFLDIVSVFLIYLISIPIGIYSSTHRRSLLDQGLTLTLFIFYSLPTFWVATMLILAVGPIHSIPISGFRCDNPAGHPFGLPGLDIFWHGFLPIACLTYGGLAALSRYARTGMLEVVRQDYIRTARAKGLSERAVIFKHALRNGMIPILTLLATLLPAMISGSVIVEQIFSIEGMGQLAFKAVIDRDYPVVMAVTTFAAFLTLAGILIGDILYVIVDPRISLEKLESA